MTNDKNPRRSAKKTAAQKKAPQNKVAKKSEGKNVAAEKIAKKKAPAKKALAKKVTFPKKEALAKKAASQNQDPKKAAPAKKKVPVKNAALEEPMQTKPVIMKIPTNNSSPFAKALKKSIPKKTVSNIYVPPTPPTPRKINAKLVHYLVNLPPIMPIVELPSDNDSAITTASAPVAAKVAADSVVASNPANSSLTANDVAAVDELGRKYQELKDELGKVIIGQEDVIEELAICLFARGHALLMGVPGLAKTLLVSCIAETMDLGFKRIQFTPDLMPADISGTDIIQEHSETGRREFEFVKGPVFSNIVLADEINRAPAKTQSAMLEAMQERRVTVLGRTYKLDAPFFVLATQNPVEQEGTYPLPEAQLDRFMFLIEVEYPSAAEEKRIARETTGVDKEPLNALLTGEEVLKFQSLVRRVPIPDHIYDYAVEIVRRTRPDGAEAPDWLKEYVSWGAGPRAVQYLILGCKARAALRGTYMASLEDIEAVAGPVLGHRVLINFAAESQGMTSKKIVARLVEEMRDEI